LKAHRQKVGAWEDGLRQARQACDAWKRDAESHRRQAEQSEREKARIVMERDQAILQLETLKAELARHGSQFEISDSIPDGPLCPRCGMARGDSRSTSTIGGHTCQLCSK